VPVTEPGQIAEAIRQKLVLEIAGLPPSMTAIPAAFTDCLVGEQQRRMWEREP
jgi:hypothetical protein